MRTPVILVVGQRDTEVATNTLLNRPGTVVVEHRLDGHVVVRSVVSRDGGSLSRQETPLELGNGCASCTIRNDLLILLRRLHRRAGVKRIVVQLAPWLEPEPVCWAMNWVRVHVGPGYIDGPAALDVMVAAVVTCVDPDGWLVHALGDEQLDDGRTMAQVVVGQVEFADVVMLSDPDPIVLAVSRRLAPRARITAAAERLEQALANLEIDSRRGRSDHPHGPLLVGQPALEAQGPVRLIEFNARRPFHPGRLHAAVDLLLAGVIRARGRLWLANRCDQVMWLESAGGGLRVSSAGKWLAAMTADEVARTDPERRAFADLMWEYRYGDRHTAMTVLVCGTDPAEIFDALNGALLTDDELLASDGWADYQDPFGDWHQDPCEAINDLAADASTRTSGDGDRP